MSFSEVQGIYGPFATYTGLVAVVLSFAALIVVHELGHWWVANKLGFKTPVFCIGFFKPYIVLGHFRDTEFRLTPWLLGGYVQIEGLIGDFNPGEDTKASDHTKAPQFPVWKRFLVAVAGPGANLVAAVIILFLSFAIAGQPTSRGVRVVSYLKGMTAAQQAGIEVNDVIIGVNGHTVTTIQDLNGTIRRNVPVHFKLQRGNKVITVTEVPQTTGRMGCYVMDCVVGGGRMPVSKAFETAASDVTEVVELNAQAMGRILHVIPNPANTPAPTSDMHGLIGIVQIGILAWLISPILFVGLIAQISVALAFMNMLPIPMLDGGHVAFLAYEKVFGKPVNVNVQMIVTMICFLLIMGLMAVLMLKDILYPAL